MTPVAGACHPQTAKLVHLADAQASRRGGVVGEDRGRGPAGRLRACRRRRAGPHRRRLPGTEKVAGLAARLSTTAAPAGAAVQVGDIAYYAPRGNLAIFYRPFGYARGLVVFGHVEMGIEQLSAADGDHPVTIAVAPRTDAPGASAPST
jgi:hypothetical protein